MSQVIGQYRFAGKSSCMTDIAVKPQYIASSMSIVGSDVSSNFRDVGILLSAPLEKGRDYYLKARIPQDANYTDVFTVKLVKPEVQGSDVEVYQFLKSVTVMRGNVASSSYTVALYGDGQEPETVRAMIPLDYSTFDTNKVENAVYFDSVSRNYYFYDGKKLSRTTRYNDVSLAATWLNGIGANYDEFDMVFRPVDDGFSKIVFEMSRQPIDYNIENLDAATGERYYGRTIKLDEFSCGLSKLNNLVDNMNKDKTLSRIGVNGHSGLLMAVNGEEIRVGASGQYELDVLPITSLGIVAQSYADNFSVDYVYDSK